MKRYKSVIPVPHDRKLSCNMGELVPLTCYEVIPGDIIRQETDTLIRTQPLLAPVMHDVVAEIFHIFVPNRIIWDEWEDFITGGELGNASPTAPTIEAPSGTGWLVGSLADHLGLRPGVANLVRSALPFRAYQRSFNYLFRDSQVVSPASVGLGSGVDVTTSRDLQMGMWGKDRYTTARPQPQLGPSVVIPLLGDAPVISDGTTPTMTGAGVTNQNVVGSSAGGTARLYTNGAMSATPAQNMVWGNNTGLEADLGAVSAFDVEDIRQASAFQRFLERLNNFGARYSEYIKSGFGVPIQDARLSEPELLATGRARFQFSEVLQTSEDGETPLGQMAGHGITANRSNRFKYFAPEHGFVLSLMLVRPKTQYQDAVHKMWSRPTRLDYYNPEFADLGDVPIFNGEVNAAHSNPTGVFGYAPAWDDYRYIPSSVSGEFRDVLDYWHMARQLPNDVALNATFIRANPTTRVFADGTSDQLYVTARHKVVLKRPIPKVSRPALR